MTRVLYVFKHFDVMFYGFDHDTRHSAPGLQLDLTCSVTVQHDHCLKFIYSLLQLERRNWEFPKFQVTLLWTVLDLSSVLGAI